MNAPGENRTARSFPSKFVSVFSMMACNPVSPPPSAILRSNCNGKGLYAVSPAGCCRYRTMKDGALPAKFTIAWANTWPPRKCICMLWKKNNPSCQSQHQLRTEKASPICVPTICIPTICVPMICVPTIRVLQHPRSRNVSTSSIRRSRKFALCPTCFILQCWTKLGYSRLYLDMWRDLLNAVELPPILKSTPAWDDFPGMWSSRSSAFFRSA